MKKLISLLLSAMMCMNLVACGGGGGTDSSTSNGDVNASTNESTDKNKTGTTLSLGETYSVSDYADFVLVSIETTKKVTASMSSDNYYENSEADQTYIDAVFDVTNTGTEALNSEDLMTAIAKSETGTEYNCHLYAVETDDMTWVTTYESIAPLSTARYHASISVPTAEKKFALLFDLNGSKFSYDYSTDTTVKKTTPLNVGDILGNEDYATLEFVGAEFANQVLPSNTSGGYSYMEVKNTDNTYFILEFKLTNYQESQKDVDTFIGATAKFMGKYKYSGRICSEDSDQKGISSYNDISPLETARVFVLIEVPKTVTDKDYTVDVCFDKQFYTITK